MADQRDERRRAVPQDWPGWPENDAERYRTEGYWEGVTFGARLRGWARDHGDRTALVDGARRWTYARLDRHADRLAAGFRGLGITRGDRVVVQVPNVAEFVHVWFALQRVGAVPVHALPGHRRVEISHLVRHSGAVAYVVPDRYRRFDHVALASEIAADPSCATLRHVIVAGKPGPHTALDDLLGGVDATADEEDPSIRPGDLAALLLSGGTTGVPKLIPRTHDDYACNALAGARVCGLGADTVYLAVLPVAFNFTFACPGVLGTLAAGGTVVLAPDPDPATAFALIARERVTVTAINPPLAGHWLDEFRPGTTDLSSLRLLQVGSARLADDLARRIRPELGVPLQQVFGMAEGLINYTAPDDPEDLVTTTQGRPCTDADEIRVVDPDDRPVPDGEPGELLTRGPYTLRGYYRAPEHNRTAFTADGFYRTGDVVRRLPSGHLVVVGRVKDQINRGGEKIAATEVEGHLLAHPDIAQAAVVGVPDARWGERPVAFVVPRPGRPVPRPRDLAAHLTARGLAAWKAPAEVVAADGLPLTPVGKIDKNALAARAAER
ncbi:AMP-binding protein [Yinghuangia sp. ASG 101]|uniref:(2,3-dihydroxybenzoyl)adenylate synthase n=1 Tax=Yinghuangia sp. ASG 101 TaxID=2896848 RepID=UPI001E495E44|nr:AMP-binding protein [Yinghuangia sp. ASG 101]UGQ12387.1 AMP-binding protein [Yinghuangia sp. ASG 101]